MVAGWCRRREPGAQLQLRTPLAPQLCQTKAHNRQVQSLADFFLGGKHLYEQMFFTHLVTGGFCMGNLKKNIFSFYLLLLLFTYDHRSKVTLVLEEMLNGCVLRTARRFIGH